MIFLVLVLAPCAFAEIRLTGQPFRCTVNQPVSGKEQLIDFQQLRIETLDNGVKGFRGTIDILVPISSLKYRILYLERRNGNTESTFRPEEKNVCMSMDNMSIRGVTDMMMTADNSPISFILDRIMEQSPNMNCNPAIQAKTYDMDDVELNQDNFKGSFLEGSDVNFEIEYETPNAYTCMQLQGVIISR